VEDVLSDDLHQERWNAVSTAATKPCGHRYLRALCFVSTTNPGWLDKPD
jgi:hypothetical protein